MFEFFSLGAKGYLRRAETMLREARFAQLEHEAAAEHYYALTQTPAGAQGALSGQLHLKKIERGRPKTGVHSSIFHCK